MVMPFRLLLTGLLSKTNAEVLAGGPKSLYSVYQML